MGFDILRKTISFGEGVMNGTANIVRNEAANIKNKAVDAVKTSSPIIKDLASDVFEPAKKTYSTIASNVFEPMRNTIRESIPGLDDVINSPSNIPFLNALETVGLSLLGEDKAVLGKEAIDLVKKDPAMQSYDDAIVQMAREKVKNGEAPCSFVYPPDDDPNKASKAGVALGGKRNEGDMWNQALHPLDNPDTWKVASNELTWMLRHVTVKSNVSVGADGKVTIDHHLKDKLDLTPHKNAPKNDAYNVITGALGAIYHGAMRGSAMNIEGNWTTESRC